MIFFRKPKIEVFVRYCYYSNASNHKKRDPAFSHEKCYQNLMQTADFDKVNFTFLLDTHYVKNEPHFIHKQDQFPVVEMDAGAEGKSFIALLDHVMQKKLSDETILYFVEDDYLHREGWVDILLEGFTLPKADYVTLFDHRDKYEAYQDLKSELFHTKSCHFRTTPSTTNTYAMRLKTLKKHLPIHRAFSEGRDISADHDKFLELGNQGATLLSSIPGWSTHAEPVFASPCINWSVYLTQEALK
ncbi:MAG: hypothetical protein K1000chlam2_00336 [Chlamydiae bacterium]|nr:hypothetical protein [Chlamydiota bacterium]